jgi:glycosyltransferase involved in cell wall biosynthesis
MGSGLFGRTLFFVCYSASLNSGSSLLAGVKERIRPYYLRWLYFRLHPEHCPPSFRACWQFPFERIDASVRLPDPRGRPVLLFFPMTDWHTRTQRTQQLVRALAAKGYSCLYINPHLGREFETTAWFDKANRLSKLEHNVYELHIRLPREPVFHHRLLSDRENDLVLDAIRAVLPHDACTIQVLSFPLWLESARRLRNEANFPMVYDCHDLLSGFQNIAPELISAERDLLRQADLVLFSSEGLREQHGQGLEQTLVLRNAVDALQFEAGAGPGGNAVAGYIGALESWLDIEALEQAAVQNPACKFVLAGRIEYEPVGRLRRLPNVELAGEVPYSRVPELLAGFQVALIPFRITPLTLMTNPIKLYEYFSCGLPVVTTSLPEAQAMGDLVYAAETPGEFGAQVSRALEEDDPPRRRRRREIALQESWMARADTLSEAFEELVRREPRK